MATFALGGAHVCKGGESICKVERAGAGGVEQQDPTVDAHAVGDPNPTRGVDLVGRVLQAVVVPGAWG